MNAEVAERTSSKTANKYTALPDEEKGEANETVVDKYVYA